MSFDTLFKFEQDLAEYTGAPYAVVTDCCTHAIELCLRLDKVSELSFTAYTYLSIPQMMRNLQIDYELLDEPWIGEYKFHGTKIWDSARRLERDMYLAGHRQCLSFGNTKPLHLGKCGAILLDNYDDYLMLSRMRSNGRDLRQSPWNDHPITVGFHYCPTIETCQQGIEKLPTINQTPMFVDYPDCRLITYV